MFLLPRTAKNSCLGLGLSVSEMETLLLKVLGAFKRFSIVFKFVFSFQSMPECDFLDNIFRNGRGR